MRRKKRSSVDVELYDSDHTYDDLLKMEDDAGKGDANIDLKLIAEFMRVSSDTKSAFFQDFVPLGHSNTFVCSCSNYNV